MIRQLLAFLKGEQPKSRADSVDCRGLQRGDQATKSQWFYGYRPAQELRFDKQITTPVGYKVFSIGVLLDVEYSIVEGKVVIRAAGFARPPQDRESSYVWGNCYARAGYCWTETDHQSRPELVRLVEADASPGSRFWELLLPTDRQRAYAERLGVTLPRHCTREECSRLIDRTKQESPTPAQLKRAERLGITLPVGTSVLRATEIFYEYEAAYLRGNPRVAKRREAAALKREERRLAEYDAWRAKYPAAVLWSEICERSRYIAVAYRRGKKIHAEVIELWTAGVTKTGSIRIKGNKCAIIYDRYCEATCVESRASRTIPVRNIVQYKELGEIDFHDVAKYRSGVKWAEKAAEAAV